MLKIFIEDISQFLSQRTKKEISFFQSAIDHTPSLEMGDYTYPCFSLAKEFKKNPGQVSQELAEQFTKTTWLEKATAQGPYLNFFVNRQAYQSELFKEIISSKDNYGRTNVGHQKTMVVEYSSPNIAKPFHMGHFRATIIGQALKNIHTALGFQCIGINYLGDWGTQFGKLIVAFKKWGDEKELKRNPIPYLNSLYIKFHEEAKSNPGLEDDARLWFKKCEDKNQEALSLWKTFKELSIQEFKKLYHILNVDFDEWSGESLYDKDISYTIDYVKKNIPTKISEGALIVDLEAYQMPPALLLRSDGASLYLTRDICAIFDRFNRYQFDKILYVAGDPQALHFRQLFKLIDLMKKSWAKNCHHISFGQILFKDQKMSARVGNVILLEDVLNKSIELIAKIIEEKNPALKEKKEISEKVGLGSIIFADFSSKRIKNVVFDWDQILNPEGDTGPYVLYTYARASSILRKAADSRRHEADDSHRHEADDSRHPEGRSPEGSLLQSPEERTLMKNLEKYPKILLAAAHDFEPAYIANYLLDLAKHFNRFYHVHRVIQEDQKLQISRLTLVLAARTVLKSGLELMGISTVEEL